MTAHTHRRGHPDLGRLLDYWFGDLSLTDMEGVDAHLFGCDACGAVVDSIAALGQGTHEAFAAGCAATGVGSRFVGQLVARGLRVREYRVPCNGSVNCSVAAGRRGARGAAAGDTTGRAAAGHGGGL